MIPIVVETSEKAIIKVVGVGGGGGNAVNRMINSNIKGVEFISANTDSQALKRSLATQKIHLGENLTGGLGAGGNPETGKKSAEESIEVFKKSVQDADMVFITCGMGGGTGTGAAPVFAKATKEMGILTVVVATKPFLFEGPVRMEQAEAGIRELEGKADSTLIIPNQKLMNVIKEDVLLGKAFDIVDDVLRQAVQAITDVITSEGLINVDFADVKAIMKDAGKALMGLGWGEGASRAITAINAAITSPLLENISIRGARGVVANITGNPTNMRFKEVQEAMELLQKNVSKNSHIYWGVTEDDSMGEKVKITIIATNFEDSPNEKVPFAQPSSSEEESQTILPPEFR